MNQLGENPIYVTEAADYTTPFAQWNTHGIADQTYTREAFQPIENAGHRPRGQAVRGRGEGDRGQYRSAR